MNQTVPKEVSEYLNGLEPGFFPFELFQSITRLTVAPILELIPLRRVANRIEVLLLRRPSDDPHWPGMLHTPGTYIRSTDTEETLDSAFNRLIEGELALVTNQRPYYVQTIFHRVTRGTELGLVYGLDLTNVDDSLPGQWFSVNDLPKNSIETQHACIKMAAELLRNHTATS
jgi:hypothetical protein